MLTAAVLGRSETLGMADSDYMKFFADMWAQNGIASPVQEGAMPMLAAATAAAQAWLTNNPDLRHAADAFAKLMSVWKDLPLGLSAQGGESKDPITTELLRRIFDPRQWMNAVGVLDGTVRQLSEGPKFADFGQMEGKFIALISAWSELRVASLEYQTHLLGAWTRAATEFAGKLNEAAGKGTMGSRSELVALWVETANRHLLETQALPAFLDSQRKLLRASTALRLAQQDLTDQYAEFFGLPTRPEIDDLTRAVTDLRREIRAARRARQKPTRFRRRPSSPKPKEEAP
jgi:polyhydroxyalkanoate synthase subunit PhaE